jgi:uncharacterized protein (TIGR02246 family)
MPARTPQEVHQIFTQAFTARDSEALVALYEPDAAFMPQPGQVVSGHAAIRDAIGGFLALNAEFKMQPGSVVEAGDIALLLSKWTLSGTDTSGAAVDLAGQTADVVRRQPDGNWLIVIDNPYGA